MQDQYKYHGLYRIDVDRLSLLGKVNGLGEFHQNLACQMDFHLIDWVRKVKKFIGWN
jgi:hypothetical protein